MQEPTPIFRCEHCNHVTAQITVAPGEEMECPQCGERSILPDPEQDTENCEKADALELRKVLAEVISEARRDVEAGIPTAQGVFPAWALEVTECSYDKEKDEIAASVSVRVVIKRVVPPGMPWQDALDRFLNPPE